MLAVLLVARMSNGQTAAGVVMDSTVRSDSAASLVFGNSGPFSSEFKKKLRGIFSAGIGPYRNVRDDLFRTDFQPTVHAEVYAVPSPLIGFLFGAHAGIAPQFGSGLSIGIRLPVERTSENDLPIVFADVSGLFYNVFGDTNSFQTGARIAVGGAIPFTDFAIEPKLVGEYRGSQTLSDGTTHSLIWAGIEVGVSMSILSSQTERTYRDSIKAMLRPIATEDEMRDINDAESRAQLEKVVDAFWARRDVLRTTPENEARNEYEHRALIANRALGQFGRLGVSTDRGRVLLVYGEPTERLEATSVYDDERRYDIWTYEGRVRGFSTAVFIFLSQRAGEFRQEYSNVTGETSHGLPTDLPGITYNWLLRIVH